MALLGSWLLQVVSAAGPGMEGDIWTCQYSFPNSVTRGFELAVRVNVTALEEVALFACFLFPGRATAGISGGSLGRALHFRWKRLHAWALAVSLSV